jgi:transposase InsO family protein
MEIFPTGKDLNAHLADYMDHYNHRRPHSALGGLNPATRQENIKTKMEAKTLTS